MIRKGYRTFYASLAFFGIFFLVCGILIPGTSLMLGALPVPLLFVFTLLLYTAGYAAQGLWFLIRGIKRPESGTSYESEEKFYRFPHAIPALMTAGAAAAWGAFRLTESYLRSLANRPGVFYDSYSIVPYSVAAVAFLAVAAGSFVCFFPYDRILTGKASIAGMTVSAAFAVLGAVGSGELSLISGLCFAGYAVAVQIAMNQSAINRSFKGATGARLDGRARGYNLTLTMAVITLFAAVSGVFYVLLTGLFTLLRLFLAMLLAGTVDDNDSELSLDSEKKVSLIGDFIFQKQKNAKYHSGKAYLFIFIAFILILLFIAIFGKRNFMKNFFEKLKNGLVNLIIAIFGPIADFLSPARDGDYSVYYVEEERRLQNGKISSAKTSGTGPKRRNWPDFVASLKQRRTAEDKYRFAYSQMVSVLEDEEKIKSGTGIKPSDTPREIAERMKRDRGTVSPEVADRIAAEFERIEYAGGSGASQEAFDSVCDIIINKIS